LPPSFSAALSASSTEKHGAPHGVETPILSEKFLALVFVNIHARPNSTINGQMQRDKFKDRDKSMKIAATSTLTGVNFVKIRKSHLLVATRKTSVTMRSRWCYGRWDEL